MSSENPEKPLKDKTDSKAIFVEGSEDYGTGNKNVDHVVQQCLSALVDQKRWTNTQLINQVNI